MADIRHQRSVNFSKDSPLTLNYHRLPLTLSQYPPLVRGFIPIDEIVTITVLLPFQEVVLLNPTQNQIIYLMFLNGLLFLGLNFVAHAIVFPGGPGSKKLGYLLFTTVALILCITQEMDILIDLKFPASSARTVLVIGFAAPVFLISLVYYRIKRYRLEQSTQPKVSDGDPNADH